MVSELVSGTLPGSGDGGDVPHRPRFAYTEVFERVFPFYLAIGMTPQQFWDGDPKLAKAYFKAHQIKQELANQQAWLQGMYVYEAIADVAPVLHAFAKKGTKMRPYSPQPYAMNEDQKERKRKADEKAKYDKIKARMAAFTAQHNVKMKEKEEMRNADNA